MPASPLVRVFSESRQLYDALLQRINSVVPPGGLVCMPTGATPLALYAGARRSAADRWRSFRYLQLDEYLDAPPQIERFRRYLDRELFDPLGVAPGRRFTIPAPSESRSIEEVAAGMDAILERESPLHLAVLGLGHNGHIAFNEPAPRTTTSYHAVELSAETRRRNSLGDGPTPVTALTIGVGQLLTAERIFLVVPQVEKQRLLDQVLEGPITPKLPATSLLAHKQLEVFRVQA